MLREKAIVTAIIFALGCVCQSGALNVSTDYTPIAASTGTIVPGEWNSSAKNGDAYAKENHVPIVVFYGSSLCSHCHSLQTACNTDEFKTWQANKGLVMVFGEDAATKTYCQGGSAEDMPSFPFIRVTWYKKDGTVFSTHFSGTVDLMPAKGDTLAAQFMNSIELYLAAYPYAGGEFLNAGTASDKLELEEGYDASIPVLVPVKREAASIAVRNILVCNGEEYSIDWAAADSGVKYVEVEVPAGVAAGGNIPLELYMDGELHSRSSIGVVAPVGVSVHNPLFLGERTVDTLAYGEWTMDYATAREKVLKDRANGVDAKMLVFITGTLWCPNCFAIDTNLLEVVQADGSVQTPVYDWARSNNVALVFFDQGRAGSDEAGFPNGMDKPRLLSYLPYGTTSGAEYMSRHRISLADALSIKKMVGEFSSSKWLAPETTATRLSQPTILLVDPETETVSARFSSYRDTTAARVFHVDENLARLDDLLLAKPGQELDGYVTTTSRKLVCGGDPVVAEFQINDKTKVFALESVPHALVTFSVAESTRSDSALSLSLVKLEDGAVVELAKGKNAVEYDFTGNVDGRYFLKAAAFGDAVKYGDETLFAAEFVSKVTPIPGVIGFDGAEQQVFGKLDNGSFKVVRTGGASGAASVKVVLVDGGTAANGKRIDWKDVVVTWADGESGEKVVKFNLLHPADSQLREDFKLKLEAVDGSLAAPAGIVAKTVVIFDSDLPTLAKEKYSITLYAGFNAASEFAETLYNVSTGAKVKVKKVSGDMPSGVKLVCDETAGKATFSGSPKVVGVFTSASTFEDKGTRGGAGPDVEFKLTVIDPKTVNPFVSTAAKFVISLFMHEDEVDVLGGVLDVSISERNKISAKYIKVSDGKKIAFSGLWNTLEGGTAITELSSKNGNCRLKFAMDDKGYVVAELVDPTLPGVVLSSDPQHIDTVTIGRRCAGSYTAVLQELAGGKEPAGNVPITLNVSADGKVKWAAKLADGSSVSGKTYITLGEDGLAQVPIFRSSAKGFFTVPIVLRPDAAKSSSRRAIRLRDNSIAQWKSAGCVHDCKAWGSYYDADVGLDTCCTENSLPNELIAYFDFSAYVPSGDGWAVKSTPEVAVKITGSKISVIEESKVMKLSFSRKDGAIKGTGVVALNNGDVKVTIAGVVVPGWYDCGCEVSGPEDKFGIETSIPFATGAACFKGAGSGKRSFVFNIGLKEE